MNHLTPLMASFCLCFIANFSYAQQQFLYVLSRSDHQITSYNLNNPANTGHVLPQPKSALVNPYAFAYDPNSKTLKWIDPGSASIRIGNADNNSNSNTAINLDTTSFPVDIQVDALHGHMYWLDHEKAQIMRSDLEGGNQELIVSDSLARPTAIALSVEDNLLFWSDMQLKRVFASNLNGDMIRPITEKQENYAVRLEVDPVAKQLYWSDDVTRTISRMNFEGEAEEVLYTGGEGEYPFGLFIDHENGWLYWTDYGIGGVKRMELENGLPETIIEDIDTPVDVLVLRASGRAGERMEDSLLPARMAPRLTVYPNPARENITIEIQSPSEDSYPVKIYNQYGQLIQTIKMQGGRQLLDTSGFANGWYICSIDLGTVQLKEQFVLIKD